jgi:tRNA-dihydrouridine synthase 1
LEAARRVEPYCDYIELLTLILG